MWTLLWCGLAMLEAAAILWLVARVMRLTTRRSTLAETMGRLCTAANMLAKMGVERLETRDALREIADQETPNANATVKRMARIAREAL